MKHQFAQLYFILIVSCIFGTNAVRWVDHHVSAINQTDEWGQLLEIEDEAEEDAPEPDKLDGAGADPDGALPSPFFATPLFSDSIQAEVAWSGRSTAIRQYQANLFDSLQQPALFILFKSYQGYLS